MSLFFISIISSIFLPGIFSLKIIGMIFNFVIAAIGAINLTYKIFHPQQAFHESDFESDKVIALICAMMFALFFSCVLSLIHYNRKDL
jgi:hypothetical protein